MYSNGSRARNACRINNSCDEASGFPGHTTYGHGNELDKSHTCGRACMFVVNSTDNDSVDDDDVGRRSSVDVRLADFISKSVAGFGWRLFRAAQQQHTMQHMAFRAECIYSRFTRKLLWRDEMFCLMCVCVCV